eukprot:2873202-Prymnesium_polylepis.1
MRHILQRREKLLPLRVGDEFRQESLDRAATDAADGSVVGGREVHARQVCNVCCIDAREDVAAASVRRVA